MQATLEKQTRKDRTTRPCSHCGVPTLTSLEDELVFCCNGCLGAYELLHDLGLESYYALRSAKLSASVEAVDTQRFRSEILQDLDAAGVAVHPLIDGSCSVRLAVDGIHCAACTWLIERMQTTIPGLLSAQVRMSDQTVELIYDPGRTQPRVVSDVLGKLGYSLSPWVVENEENQGFQHQQREHWAGIASAAFFAANAMWIGIALYAGESTGMASGHQLFLRWLGTVLAVLATVFPGRVFFQTAWQSIRTRTPHIDLPIAFSLLMGVVGSVVGAVDGVGHIYFDSLASLILLLRIGRFIQFRAQYRTRLSIARLLGWDMVTAMRIEMDGSHKRVPAARLLVGDRIEICPGETVPADGLVISGVSSVDTSLLNGETRPVAIRVGALVTGGTINLSGVIEVTVTAAGQNSRVGRLMELVHNAASNRTPWVMAADRVSKWFVSVVLMLAVGTWATWSYVSSYSVATQNTMALLTIACPCALALAAPLVITVALGRAAKRQIWIRDGNCLERLATPGFLWLDKTGTMTTGRMTVLDWHGSNEGLVYARILEQAIQHPIAKAICEFVGESNQEATESEVIGLENCIGKGVKGWVNGVRVAIGSQAWIAEQGVTLSEEWIQLQAVALEQNRSPVWLLLGSKICGMFELGDPLRDDAAETLRAIAAKGWELGILSGDRQEIVDVLVRRLAEKGIAIQRGLGQQTPEEKLEVVRRDKRNRKQPIAMVGDGVNDAAALALADIGIAIRGDGRQSLASAPIFLANNRLSSINELLNASDNVVAGIRRCFVASLVYNSITISLAMMGWIHPLIAAILMPISGLTVLAMAMSTNTFSGAKSK